MAVTSAVDMTLPQAWQRGWKLSASIYYFGPGLLKEIETDNCRSLFFGPAG